MTPEVPRYDGCFIAFDAVGMAADAQASAIQASSGVLTLQFAADPASMGAFAAIELALLDCAGANRGAARDVGWARVPTLVKTASLDVASGASVTVAEGTLPAGQWDRVFAAAPEAWGVGAAGERTALYAHVEPIARGFVMPSGGHVTVTMQVTTRARPAGWDGGWNVFTKDAWLVADDPRGP